MFSCALEVPLFLCCVRKSSFWSPLHSSFSSDLNNSGEQHVFCYLNVGCELGIRQRSATQRQCNGKSHCGRSGHWRQDRHLAEREPSLGLRTASSNLPVSKPQHLQYGGMGRLNISFHDLDRAEASSIHPKRLLARETPATSLEFWRTNAAWTQVSLKNATSCTSWFSLAAATNQVHCPDSSRLVRRKDSGSVRSRFPSSCRDSGSGCERDLVRSEFNATEKKKKEMDKECFVSPRCTPQLYGHQRARDRLSLGAGSTTPTSPVHAVPFQPRFLRSLPILLSRADRLSLRGSRAASVRSCSQTSSSASSSPLSERTICVPVGWFRERVHFHLTNSRSFRLKPGVCHDHCRSSSAPALLNVFSHGGYAGVRLGEARNPGPAAHERDRVAEERIARQRRINELCDSVPGSQDSITRGVQKLQLTDTRLMETALPAPAPPPMPNSRRPSKPRARQQQEYLRCAQCGPDPEALKGATDHGLMLHMVQKHGG